VDSVLFNLESTAVNSISDTPSLVVLAERLGGAAARATREAVQAAASRVAREWRDEGAREVLFFKAFERHGRVTKQLREQLGLGKPGDVPDVVLVDGYCHYSYNAYCDLYRVVADASQFVEQGLLLRTLNHARCGHPLFHFVSEFVRGALPPTLKRANAGADGASAQPRAPAPTPLPMTATARARAAQSGAGPREDEYDSDGHAYAF
jgi:hypothetical protein